MLRPFLKGLTCHLIFTKTYCTLLQTYFAWSHYKETFQVVITRVSLTWTWNYGWLTIKSFFILSPNDYHLMTVLLLNQFVSNIALLYPWRNRKPYEFLMWCFQWVKKYNNGYKLVNMASKYCLRSSKICHKLGLFLTAGNIFRSRLMRQLTLHL